jgi:hypothetical protein
MRPIGLKPQGTKRPPHSVPAGSLIALVSAPNGSGDNEIVDCA